MKKDMRYPETARRMNQIIAETGLSPQELANKSGVSKYNISHFRNGYHKPGNLSAAAIWRVTGYNPLWIMGLEDDPHAAFPQQTKANAVLAPDEEEVPREYDVLVAKIKRLDDVDREAVSRMIDGLLTAPKYKKDASRVS